MNDFTEMFDDSMSAEERMETAAQILKVAADEEGIDLESLPPEELHGMMSHIMGEDEGGDGSDESDDDDDGDEDDDDDDDEGGKTASDVTFGDVVQELNKRASAEGIDPADLDADTTNYLLDKIAQEMTDPDFYEEQQKWASQVAQMDELGRVAARGFCDEIDKIAEDDDDDDDKKKRKDEEKVAAIMDRVRGVGRAISGGAKKGWGHASSGARRAGGAVRNAEHRVSEGVGRRTPGGVHGPMTQEHARSRGRKIIGGTAGTIAAGAGGRKAYKHYKGKDKKASYVEDAALELARQTLLENGIDPDSGYKIAADEEVSQRAYEILQAAGYQL